MRRAAAGIGRDVLARRIVERRVHQHVIGRSGPDATGGKFVRRRGDVQRDGAHPLLEAVAHDVLPRAMPESSGSISTSVTSTSGQRTASARPAAPTPAPNSTTRSPGRAAVAAASRMASWPTRWPRFFWSAAAGRRARRRRCVSGFGPPIRGRSSCASPASSSSCRATRQCLLIDHDAARQHAERAFQHAHVLVQHHVRNVGALEQRLDRGDQHRVVGPDQLVHDRQPRRRSPAGARCAR